MEIGRESAPKFEGRLIRICVVLSGYRLLNSGGYDRALPRRRTHDHRAIDTPRFLSYRQNTTDIVYAVGVGISRRFLGFVQDS